MDTIVQGPPEDGGQDLSLEWTHSSSEIVNNNSTLLYIAVEYVKDEFKMEAPVNSVTTDTFDFDQHVSPLDPNMSSVAPYSPVYTDPQVVIHQLVPPDGAAPMPVLCNNDIREVVDGDFLTPPVSSQEQEVALLITDQETGISYSVRPQEFLVEDEQLLSALGPDPLLDSHLLALDENTLKTELNDDIINSTVNSAVNRYITSLSDAVDREGQYRMETRRQKHVEGNFEEQLLAKVYSIMDRPVLSRARATLPESYLSLNKVDDGYGVFTKKMIPRSTQFGPLTGTFKPVTSELNNRPIFLIENEQNVVNEIDVSDENASNWMRFIRKAINFNEQNLLITQEGDGLYFTTTKNISIKQELKVGYSVPYATRHKLSVLIAPEEAKPWPCFECTETFSTSELLQKHLNIHDDQNNKNNRKRNKKKIQTFVKTTEALQCNNCKELFLQPAKLVLRQHLLEKHLLSNIDILEEHFTSIINYVCENCSLFFKSEDLVKIHVCLHIVDSSDEQPNHICPECQKKFPTRRQLVSHVSFHSITFIKPPEVESFECTECHKKFTQKERLRRHMLVHSSDESKPLQCKTCNKRFINTSALAGHIKTHFTGKRTFECPICKEKFDNIFKLRIHVPKHCENNLFECPYCNKVFKKYTIIRKHIRAFHAELKHRCQYCIKMFPTLDKLKLHLLRHSDHREFLCADCGKQFKRKDKLNEHCKRMHSEERENDIPLSRNLMKSVTKKLPMIKTAPNDFHRFIYKCHSCLVGFKRRGMLVNHLAKRHPDISPDSVPELNLPILQTTRDYYCQHCDKVYKSSSKRKAHILKNHPGAALPMSNRKQANFINQDGTTNLPNPTFSQTVGSITTQPQNCKWCHKQYASKAKLLQHQRKKHTEEISQCHNDNRNDEQLNQRDCLQAHYKVSEVDILAGSLNDFNESNETEYCNLMTTMSDDGFEQNNTPNSHLYRLLTTNNELPNLVPPR